MNVFCTSVNSIKFTLLILDNTPNVLLQDLTMHIGNRMFTEFCSKNNVIIMLSVTCHFFKFLIQPYGLMFFLLLKSPNFVEGYAYLTLRVHIQPYWLLFRIISTTPNFVEGYAYLTLRVQNESIRFPVKTKYVMVQCWIFFIFIRIICKSGVFVRRT